MNGSRTHLSVWRFPFLPKGLILAWMGLLSVWLAGCTTGALSINAQLSLSTQERWRMQVEAVYAQIEIQYVGPQIEQLMQQAVQQMRAQGISASYSKRTLRGGNLSYTIKASGQGYALLNQNFFDGLASIMQDPASGQVSFSYAPFGSYFSAALSRTFTLQSGQILSGNGRQVGAGQMQWLNPLDTMQATVKPGGGLSLEWLPVALGGLAVLGIVVLVARKAGKKRCVNCGQKLSRKADYCPYCGSLQGSY